MKIKEILVGVTFPYQLAPYMYGKVDLTELISIDEGEDVEAVRKLTIIKLREQCKAVAADIILSQLLQPEKTATGKAEDSTGHPPDVRRRRF